MIQKQEIVSLASAANLLPTTIEKDYVLSWVLYGISKHSQLSKWLFKGGTCLKKCYFETYRFSEDLDFTAPRGSFYSKEEIKIALNDVADLVYQETGINLKTREIEVEESINKQNHKTYVTKFTYLGPLNLPSRNQQRVKFDITDDEIIVDPPQTRAVFHPYSDAPNPAVNVKCYSINEILAEKTRALYERQGKARDIFDVVNINRNFREYVDVKKARSSLKEKFKFKSLSEPSVEFIISQVNFSQLESDWENQLGHQLQILPTTESYYKDLRAALSWWIDEHPTETMMTVLPNTKEEKILPRVYFPETKPPRARKLGIGREVNINMFKHLDQIRYAAKNRMSIEIQYHGVTRLVEPYSLRQSQTGTLLLYVYELKRDSVIGGGIKAYRVTEITSAKVTHQTFSPRYVVEL